MTSAVAHRGPDDEGYVLVNRGSGEWAEFSGFASPEVVRASMPSIEDADDWVRANQPDLALGHRRFSIIAPAPSGHQPFWDARRRACVVVNGEIYNYLELRDELTRAGHGFATATDTEVLLAAYLEWGDRCFERFNGMWALALYDFRTRELVLSRDRAGERQLYWIRRPNGIYFASEIRSLLACDDLAELRGVNDEAVHNFLCQGTSDLDGKTFFAGIENVPAATSVRIGVEGAYVARRYWRMPEPTGARTPESALPGLADELRHVLREAVGLRLRSDFPVTIALSGGMDSSSIVAMAVQERGPEVDTYTVRFREPQWNEWEYARAVAERFRVRNLVVDPPSTWVWDHLGPFVRAMEEPFHAPDLLTDHVVRRMLASRGFRVSISGIGGDELFAGYDSYRRLHALDQIRDRRYWSAVKDVVLVSDRHPVSAVTRVVVRKWQGLLGRGQTPAANGLLASALATSPRPKLAELPQTLVERLRADVEWSLLPYWLRAGDKSSMAVPIEVRYPFLDHRLLELAARLPTSCLIRDGWLKWILRKAMDGVLPDQVVWRRAKMGFPFPIAEWLRSATPELALIFRAMDNPYLASRFWTTRLPEAIRRDPGLVWRALSFELWHRHFVRGESVLPTALERRVADRERGGDSAHT
jgi:asparagine synthase (glutamine-hydrolysing)